MRRVGICAVGLAMLVAAMEAGAQSKSKVFVYPSKDQSKEQQSKDTAACEQWANEQAPTSAQPSGPGTHARGAVGGAARGAAVGAAVGAIAGDAGKGAGAGAVVGGVGGRRRSKQQQQQVQEEQGDDWARAFAACMESRGYSVK